MPRHKLPSPKVLRPSARLVWLLAALFCLAQTGCVQRRMTIRSNPPGAVVYVDDYEIGTTPVATDFVYYGTRKIRLVKDGYETLTVYQPIAPPWYEYPVLDFFSENIVPGEIRDERVLDYQLQPQLIVPTDQLLGRAENLRLGVQSAPAGPPPQPGVRGFLPGQQPSGTPLSPSAAGPAQPFYSQPLPSQPLTPAVPNGATQLPSGSNTLPTPQYAPPGGLPAGPPQGGISPQGY